MLDCDVFDAVTAKDQELARELTGLYRTDATALLNQMNEASAMGLEDEVHRAAHTLKSSSASLGALDASKLAADIEAGGIPAAESLLEELTDAVEAAVHAMEEHSAAVNA